MASTTPPPPPGFVVNPTAAAPVAPPPPGFSVVQAAPAQPEPPPGFSVLTPPDPADANFVTALEKGMRQTYSMGADGFPALVAGQTLHALNTPEAYAPQVEARPELDAAAAPLQQRAAELQAILSRGERRADRKALELEYAQARNELNKLDSARGIDQTDEAAIAAGAAASLAANTAESASRAIDIAALPTNEAFTRMMNPKGDTFWQQARDVGRNIVSDPIGVATELAGNVIPQMAPILASNYILPGVGPFVAGGGMEASAEMQQQLSDAIHAAGVDPFDRAAVAEWAEAHPDVIGNIVHRGKVRGAIIGATDAVGLGITEQIAKRIVPEGVSAARRAGGLLAGSAAEMVTGGTGEALAQAGVGDKLRPGDIAAEALGEGIMGGPVTAIQAGTELLRSSPKETPLPTDTAPTIAQPEPPEGFTVTQQPAAEPAVQPAVEPAAPLPQQAVEPSVEPAVEPAAEPTAPVAQPAPVDTALQAVDAAPMPTATPAQPRTQAAPAAPVRTPEFQAELDAADAALPQKAQDAVTAFVGHGPNSRDKSGMNAIGIMRRDGIEAAAADPNSEVAQQLETAFAPIREKLRTLHGNDVALVRSQQPVGEGATPRNALSWTSETDVADSFAGVLVGRKIPDTFTDDQINTLAAQYDATGEVTIPGSKYSFRREDDGASLYQGSEYITGFYDKGSEVANFLRGLNADYDGMRASDTKKRESVIRATVPLDDVMWITDRAGQMEFIVRNRPGTPAYVGPDGKQTPVAAGAATARAPARGQPTAQTGTEQPAPQRSPIQEAPPGVADAAAEDDWTNDHVDDTPGAADTADAPGVPAAAEDRTRIGRGALTPAMENVSYTNRNSNHAQAFRDAGLDPARAQLLPAAQQVNILTKLMRDKFGLRVSRGSGRTKLIALDAVNQLLDAYRNGQFMLHVLQLPLQALSLNGRVSLTLEKQHNRYLGVYRGQDHSIGLPGRSNSFAHEWMHALDHFLNDTLKPGAVSDLLTRLARRDGLDPTDSLEAAFVNLINKMFYKDAALVVKMLALEQTAARVDARGNPTRAALNALDQLERLRAGNSRLKIDPSAYRQDSAGYAPSAADYFASVHEMTARAFEAYIAHKVELAGGTTEFLTKGDEAYLSNADRRLAMTFPKAYERVAIFLAFDDLFHALRNKTMFGTDNAAERPADMDFTSPAALAQMAMTNSPEEGFIRAIKSELTATRNLAKTVANQPIRASLKAAVSHLAMNSGIQAADRETGGEYMARALKHAGDSFHMLLSTMRGVAKRVIARAPKEAQPVLEMLMHKIMSDPGTNHEIGATFEQVRDQKALQADAVIHHALRANKIGNHLRKADNAQVRELLLGNNPGGVRDALANVAAVLRKLMNDAYREAVASGMEMGFVEDTGYVPRVLIPTQVQNDVPKFLAQAAKLYRVVFDRDTEFASARDVASLAREVSQGIHGHSGAFQSQASRVAKAVRALRKAQGTPAEATAKAEYDAAMDALKSALRDPYAKLAAESWRDRILMGDSVSFDSLGPIGSFSKSRTLPKAADTIMAEFYEQDMLQATMSYVRRVAARSEYQARYGKTGGASRLENILDRQAVADAAAADPARYNRGTTAGRLNIIRDLANPRLDDIKEMLIREAVHLGVNHEDIEVLRNIVDQVTGRGSQRGLPALDRITGALWLLGFIRLLPRAALTAIAEPTTFLMRTGDFKNSGRLLMFYMREAVRGAKSTQELAALAEMVGVITTPLHDMVLLNRMGVDAGNVMAGNKVAANFARANGLAQITNAQRRASLAAGTYWLADMARGIQAADAAGDAGKAGSAIGRADLRELGVPNADADAFIEWLANLKGLPDLDALATPHGKLYSAVMGRFVDQTIQNPHRIDKPYYATTPIGRLAFMFTSFLFSFYRNVHLATAHRTQRNYGLAREAGQSKTTAAVTAAEGPLLGMAAGFAASWAAQMVVGGLREFLLNHEQWTSHDDDGDLWGWLTKLSFSRTGAMGPADPFTNAFTGLRYERDLSNMMVGPSISYVASNVANIWNGMFGARNSQNTNTSERTAAKSAYNLVGATAASWGLSSLGQLGILGNAARYPALIYLTSNSAAASFADATVGPANNAKSGPKGKPAPGGGPKIRP